jgi:ABC-type dipeptide/oligopeptide/nickel transport system ATPase component
MPGKHARRSWAKSGCGKSVTARSMLRLLDRPGRIVGRGSSCSTPARRAKRRFDHHERGIRTRMPLRKIRGGQIGMIFQEPMSGTVAGALHDWQPDRSR